MSLEENVDGDCHPAPCSPVEFKDWLQSHVDHYHEKMNSEQHGSDDWYSYRSMRWAFMFVMEKFLNPDKSPSQASQRCSNESTNQRVT